MFVSYSQPICVCMLICYLLLDFCSLNEIQILIVKRHEYYAVAENVVVLPF